MAGNRRNSAQNGNKLPETRKCDLCGELVSRMFFVQSPECRWDFEGEHAHMECYIKHLIQKYISESTASKEEHDKRFEELMRIRVRQNQIENDLQFQVTHCHRVETRVFALERKSKETFIEKISHLFE